MSNTPSAGEPRPGAASPGCHDLPRPPRALLSVPRWRALAALGAAVAFAVACKDDATVTSGPDPGGEQPEYRVSTKSDVQWKRYAALEADLSRALELDPATLCSELGQASCIRQVHLFPLGGNEPFQTGVLQPSGEPLATTPAIVDRILLSACARRAALDRDAPAGQAVVFAALDLNAAAPPASDPNVAATISELYRRLLSRAPSAEEIEGVAELTLDGDGQPVAATDFATLACFTIGGSTEFLFY